MKSNIIGWAHTKFGKLADETLESLIVTVATEALEHSGLAAQEIDVVYLGHFNAGFSAQDFTASLVLQADSGLRFKPVTRVENACATGSAAVHHAVASINGGQARTALVVGVEQMTMASAEAIGSNLLKASYLPESAGIAGGFAGVFGQIADRYYQRYGDQTDALALIAAKNHANGVKNPLAQLRKEFSFEFCRSESSANPRVAGPLKRTDCSPVSDGAAAIVLASDDVARTSRRSVRFRSVAHVQDFLPLAKRDILAFEGCSVAWRNAMANAGISLDDLSFVETHDCFTIAELLEYEAMGLTKPGQGASAIREGWTRTNGKLPVNPSGGLKAKGHPIGATGVSMHVLSAMQLCQEAGEMQIAGASLAGVYNMGGAAVANYVSILEAKR
ncbi:acetyl-CoA acetyltransferase [Agrobacterium tumefaciens]|uniref:Acetyl-CoA acetyltransferase n=1 Tax=Agrobacterium tumefaciens TaxID=358 RepID=A0A176XG50_AGRTU|nr:acetyl-CoA acetyltransferase [Agrobacterium tumefaciens]OAE48193.1 acetyl-CoA acetyltransferase [Agrobacterium tumefaciens]